MDQERRIISDITRFFTKKLINKLVYKLQRFPKESRLFSEDSRLKNTWDEICVQEQTEKSFFWEIYDETVADLCNDYIQELPIPIQKALEYEECLYSSEDYDRNVLNTHLVVDSLKTALFEYAGNYENKQIRDFIERQYLD